MKRTLSCLLLLAMLLSVLVSPASAAERKIFTTPTGYTSASDVEYITRTQDGKTIIVNWGARGENCVFLSQKALEYYTDEYTYAILSANQGGTSQSNAPQSALYHALKSMMTSKHAYQTSYQFTRNFYQYTDCVSNDYGKLSSFYSGKIVNGTWDSGKTYNREHTWPNSKGLGGNDENDIMMLRPTIVSENTSRGNDAYGESSGYFDPGADVRGDCARIALYVYTRWGNTGRMWGSSGVIENLTVLLKWMAEDPVDTWEMGRNDSVQSLTGVRNVFIDYPELAWKLFGKEVPANLTTPGRGQGSYTPPVTETTTPSVTETTAPSVTETTAPSTTETTAPAATETTAPPVTETTAPPTIETTVPSTAEGTVPPTAESTVPPTTEAIITTVPATGPVPTESTTQAPAPGPAQPEPGDFVWLNWVIILAITAAGTAAVIVVIYQVRKKQ